MKNIIQFVFLSFFWGTAFVGVKNTVDVLDPYFSAFLRCFIGFVFFAVWYVVARKSVYVPKKDVWRPWLAGFLIIGLPFVFLYWGQRFVPSGVGGIFNGTVPLWVFIIAALTIKGEDSFSWRKAGGVLLGFVGLLFIFKAQIISISGDINTAALYGSISLVMMAICYAAGNVLTKYILSKDITVEANIFHQHLFSTVFLFFVVLLGGANLPGKEIFQPKVMISIFYVALCSSALALLLLFRLLKVWGALKASMATYFVPFIALAADFVANGRVPSKDEWIGLTIIIASLLIVQLAPSKTKSVEANQSAH